MGRALEDVHFGNAVRDRADDLAGSGARADNTHSLALQRHRVIPTSGMERRAGKTVQGSFCHRWN